MIALTIHRTLKGEFIFSVTRSVPSCEVLSMKRPHGRGPGSGSVLVWADRMFLPSRPMFGFQNRVKHTRYFGWWWFLSTSQFRLNILGDFFSRTEWARTWFRPVVGFGRFFLHPIFRGWDRTFEDVGRKTWRGPKRRTLWDATAQKAGPTWHD